MNSTVATTPSHSAHSGVISGSEGVVIIYGRGGDLGNFKYYAEHLKRDLSRIYRNNIIIKNIERKIDFYNFIKTPNCNFKVKELHIFAHSIGGGIWLGYGDEQCGIARLNLIDLRGNHQNHIPTYWEVCDAEIGAVLSDDFKRTDWVSSKSQIRSHLSIGCAIKIWGCNSGVSNWPYTDDDWSGDGIPEKYWSVLNTQNFPKPCIAQAISNFFGVKVFGAKSGSHSEVLVNITWITSEEYKRQFGRWPNPVTTPHRLHPDRGMYYQYDPI